MPAPRRRAGGRRVGALAGLVILAWAVPAAAQVRVAFEDLSLEGDLAAEAAGPLGDAVREGLGAAAEAADPGAAEAWVGGRVSQLGQIYSVDLELRLAAEGAPTATATDGCDVCTWAEALDAARRAGAALAASLPGVLVLTVTPPGAALEVDGAPAEPGARLVLPLGAHRVVARLEGREPVEQTVSVEAGGLAEASLELPEDGVEVAPPGGGSGPGPGPDPGPDPGGSAPPEALPGPSALAIAGWVTAGGAVAALVPGVLWLALEGQCAIGSPTEQGLCRDVYYTWPQGLALTALAVALGATSAILFGVDHARRRRETGSAQAAVVLVPGPSGAVAAVLGRF